MSKVTIVGAGKYGSMTALRTAEFDIVDSVVMTDIVEGITTCKSKDVWHQMQNGCKYHAGAVLIAPPPVSCICTV